MLIRALLLGLVLPALAMAEPPAQSGKKYSSAALARGVNEFAFDLYQQLAKEAKPDQNIFFGPYSISAEFAMTFVGARRATADEICKLFHFHPDLEQFHFACYRLRKDLLNRGLSIAHDIDIANAIWTGVPMRDEYRRVVEGSHRAAVRMIDFSRPEEARKEINSWVAERTKDKVKELLPPDAIGAKTEMVVTNAVHFKAGLQTVFEKELTKPAKFFRTPDDPVMVPTMQLVKAAARHTKLEHLEIVQLPYGDSRYALVIILPTSHDRLRTVEKSLHRWSFWMDQLGPKEVDLVMPRVNARGKFQLQQPLSEMGLTRIFSNADFSGIGPVRNPHRNAYHETRLDIEEGERALGRGEGSVGFPWHVRVVIDRPFLIAVRDTESGCLLFFGRIMNP